jgi:hypothetical protein
MHLQPRGPRPGRPSHIDTKRHRRGPLDGQPRTGDPARGARTVAGLVALAALLWRARRDLAHAAAHASWAVGRGVRACRTRLRRAARRLLGPDAPRGTYLHLVDGRDVPLTPRLTGYRDGVPEWTLTHPAPVWIAPHALADAQIRGEHLPSDCLLTLHIRQDRRHPDTYRFRRV